VRKGTNGAGINPDRISQTAFLDFIRQTGIRVEQRRRGASDCS